jgi:hypothetical protein
MTRFVGLFDTVYDYTLQYTHTCAHARTFTVTWLRLPVADVTFPLGSWSVPGQNIFFSQFNTCGHNPYMSITSTLMRGWVCHLQFLLALTSAFILGSESRGTQTILYCLRFETILFVTSCDLQGYGGGIWPRFQIGDSVNKSKSSQSHIATDGQSVSKSWCWAAAESHDRIFVTFDSYSLLFVGCPLWQDRSVFCIFSWLLPGSLSWVRVVTIFYCLRFETSLFVASYDSQGHGGGIQPCLHMGVYSPNTKQLTGPSYNISARTA